LQPESIVTIYHSHRMLSLSGKTGRENRMLAWRTIGLDALEAPDSAALERQRMVGLVSLLLQLLAWPMIGFGIGFFILLGDPWLGAETLAGLGMLGAFAIHRRGHVTAARVLCCVLAALVYFNLLIAFGTHCGIELWSIPMIAFPPLIVTRSERRLLLVLYLIFATAMLAGLMVLMTGPPRIEVDPGLAAVLRASNLILDMIFVGAIVIFYYVRNNQAEATISRERERSDRLLDDILPHAISTRLKRNEHPIADQFEDVTVLFADFVGFTSFAARNTPEGVVGLLNTMFYAFDDMVERRGLEKIKTSGDGYLVAAGLPASRDDHAPAIADLALEMVDFVARLREEGQPYLDLRIGLNSGPVGAGIIGKRKFSYDLWGDTVNTASRLETTSEPGRIQISEETARRLDSGYALADRGIVQLKGLAPMRSYFLMPPSPSG
jgi:class 3 adenylate cyclase